jgi:NAD(P)-dependent dehydrogenase (short-subunit alcohol dehydrogenase family)
MTEVREATAADAIDRFGVADRAVLVTGAAHGLGLAVATAFGGAGARVVGLDVDAVALQDLAGQRGIVGVVPADLASDARVASAADEALALLGGLDVLVNCAATFPVGGLATTVTAAADLVTAVDVNVAGGVRLLRTTADALRASRAGRVVNFSSVVIHGGVPPEMGAYVASKAAVVGVTRALARELGPDGITVNAIAPGSYPTRAEQVTIVDDREAFEAQLMAIQSVKRRGEVHDIACAVLFLASDAAAFITGQTLTVDGGIYCG